MEALSYKLPVFEGPLDLMLTLISKNKLNIYDIPIALLLEQYIEQIDIMRRENLDIQSEFFEMAARLVHIKTIMLLPRHEDAQKLKQELEGRLIEYKACKEAAENFSKIVSFDGFVRVPAVIEPDKLYSRVHDVQIIYNSYISAAGRGQRKIPPTEAEFKGIVRKKIVPVSTKIIYVLRRVYSGQRVEFVSLFENSESKSEVVATFLAILELVKSKRIEISDKDGKIGMTQEVERRWRSKRG